MCCDTTGDWRVARWLDSRRDICLRTGAALALALLASWATPAGGQIPGAPVLQNAWATPGIVGALDVGGGSGASVYAAAVSWAPGAGHFQLSGGGGIETRLGHQSRGVYGLRAAVPLGGASSTFGFAAFAGIGGGPSRTTATTLGPCRYERLPGRAGFGVQHRRSAGGRGGRLASRHRRHSRCVGVCDPVVRLLLRRNQGRRNVPRGVGGRRGHHLVLGATLGIEFGGKRARGLGGPTGSLYGFGLSYALGPPVGGL